LAEPAGRRFARQVIASSAIDLFTDAMTISAGLRRGILLAATGMMLTGGAARAQEMDSPQTPARAQFPQGAIVQPIDTGPGAELRRNLVTLANNPRSLDALIGAGRAANAMGDAEAALGFFARADEIDPSNARVKAGMAASLVRMERADQALPLFARAIALGAPEGEIAADRGLAYDLAGDSARAQRDYQLALRHRADPEVERRLALSLAISGHRDQALRVLDGQLRRRDRAGWRAQAFVLALTGDARGAEDTAGRMMAGANAQAMVPFFQRLHMLTPAQKAAAVHFGRFPANARSMQVASYQPVAEPPVSAPTRTRPQPAEPLNDRPGRRSRGGDSPVATLIRTPRRTDAAPPVEPRREPVQMAQAEPQRFEPPAPEPEPQAAAPEPTVQQADIPPSEPAAPGFSISTPEPTSPRIDPPTSRPADFSAVAALVQSLPTEQSAPPPARPAAREARATTAEARPTRTAEAQPSRSRSARNAPPPNPARHWVQVAGGANRASMPREFARLRDQAPALLRSRTAYVTPANATNRLLVGPFDSEREAQAFVNRLGQSDVRAFAWTSAAGQEIERLRTTETPRTAGAGARPRQEQRRTTANESRASRNRPEPQQGTASRGRRSR
jgi:Flp pilus assembly protein TadD